VTDQWDRETRSRVMSRIRSRDTGPEIALRRALWAAGLRGWRLHPKRVPGRPDVAWIGRRIAVFVDGAFWHGHPDHYHGQSGPYWDEKIARNRARDVRVNAELRDAGWTVLRFWDFEVEKATADCVKAVAAAVGGTEPGRSGDHAPGTSGGPGPRASRRGVPHARGGGAKRAAK
jgi:DNA mismatch endonuclease, patch repair protein